MGNNLPISPLAENFAKAALPKYRALVALMLFAMPSARGAIEKSNQDPKTTASTIPGIFDDERKKKPTISTDEYITILAEKLRTPEQLQQFFDLRMKYVSDHGDYWQHPFESILRTQDGKMQGDCDDYAFLVCEILKKQGHNAHIVSLPGHAECMWVTQRPDGRFDGHSMGTFAYDCNGNSIRQRYKLDPEKTKGYATIAEALNSLCLKYRNHPSNDELAKAKKPQLREATIDPQNVAVLQFLDVLPPVQVRQHVTIPIDQFTPRAPPSYSPPFSKPLEKPKQEVKKSTND